LSAFSRSLIIFNRFLKCSSISIWLVYTTDFENGSNMGGFISYPTGINEVAFAKFKDDFVYI
jgi:hypothetical protein